MLSREFMANWRYSRDYLGHFFAADGGRFIYWLCGSWWWWSSSVWLLNVCLLFTQMDFHSCDLFTTSSIIHSSAWHRHTAHRMASKSIVSVEWKWKKSWSIVEVRRLLAHSSLLPPQSFSFIRSSRIHWWRLFFVLWINSILYFIFSVLLLSLCPQPPGGGILVSTRRVVLLLAHI